MEVFPQSCIPLASNLKGSVGPNSTYERKPTDLDSEDQWSKLMGHLAHALNEGESPTEIAWDYDCRNLFSPRLKDKNGKRLNFQKSSPERLLRLLQEETYWYKRLPSSGRHKVKKLVKTPKGRTLLKESLHTADGVLCSLIFSVPERINSYSFTDRVTNSVLMNCFHSYAKYQKALKKVRKEIKWQFMTSGHVRLADEDNRRFSFFGPLITYLNNVGQKWSKATIFRLAVSTQTRATGLADSRMADESIETFLEMVTVRQSFEPDRLLLRCMDEVTDLVAQNVSPGQNPEFRISASSSACYQVSKKRGGKFQFLSDLVKDAGIKIPDLAEGRPGALGDFAYAVAKDRFILQDKEQLKVNVAAVRENGKARVVTSGSFYKEAALQPYSHLTIHAIKNLPNIRDGLKAAKLGFKAAEGLHHDEYGVSWIFSNKKIFMYSVDWKNATDKPTPQMAKELVIDRLLTKLGVPPDELEMIEFYWLSPKELYRKKKRIGTLVNGVPMGDPLTKTCLSLAHPICDLYARYTTGALAIEKGNGDDTTAITDDPAYCEAHEKAAAMLGYEVSPLDRFIHPVWATYCEEWYHRPLHKSNTVKTAMKTGSLGLLPYLDVPKLRIMIGTAKERIDFSSDITGKITLMGKEDDYTRKLRTSPYRTVNSIASSIQDALLSTIHQPTPLHLPRQVYGVGKAAPDWNVTTWMNIIKRGPLWKRGVYYIAMYALNRDRSDLLPKGYLKESKHFNKEAWVECLDIHPDDPIRDKRVLSAEESKLFPGTVLSKLKRMGYLMGQSTLMKYYLFQERLDTMGEVDRDLFTRVKEQVSSLDPESISDEILEAEVTQFCNRFSHRPFDVRRDKWEDLYDFDAVKTLEQGNPLRVTTVHFPFLDRFIRREPPKSRYEEEGRELYEWFLGAKEQLLAGEEPDYAPPWLLEDDPLIIHQIALMETSHYIVATDDQAMLRKAERKVPGVVIIQISCADLFKMTDNDYGDAEEVVEQVAMCYQVTMEDVTFLVDTGSLEAYTELRTTMKSGQNEITSVIAGIPWNLNVERKNVKVDYSRRPTFGGKLKPHQLGYPQKGFAYRRRGRS